MSSIAAATAPIQFDFDESHRFFRRIISLSLPLGKGLVLAAEAYFDESGSHAGAPVTCLAGYLLDAGRCIDLDLKWRTILKDHGLEYFHMSECAHRTNQFEGWNDKDCDVVARKMIALIKAHVSAGIIVTMREADLEKYKPVGWNPAAGPYSICTYWCFTMVSAWADKYGYQDSITYLFEAGHRHQTQTNLGIDMMCNRGELFKAYTRYRSHSFLKKRDACALQAADILAWEWYEDCLSRIGIRKYPRRGSLKSLLEVPHIHNHFSEDSVRQFFQYGKSGFADPPAAMKITLLTP